MGNACDTVVLRLVGAATLVGHKAQLGSQRLGDAKIHGCVGGYGPVAATASEAADCLLRNRPVRIPASWEAAVRHVMAIRALAGCGPDGNGRNWPSEPEDVSR